MSYETIGLRQIPLPSARTVPSKAVAAAPEVAELRSLNARLVREIAYLKRREAAALSLAARDGLTGLYNRRGMTELLRAVILKAARDGHRACVLFIDLDGFKRVNDEHGHSVGDRLLVTVAGRIAGRARTGDIVCRYGGDEFIVLLPRVPDAAVALEVAAKIAERVALPCRIDGVDLQVTAAIGVSMYPDDGRTVGEVLNRADARMYDVKSSARNPGSARPDNSRRRDDEAKPFID